MKKNKNKTLISDKYQIYKEYTLYCGYYPHTGYSLILRDKQGKIYNNAILSNLDPKRVNEVTSRAVHDVKDKKSVKEIYDVLKESYSENLGFKEFWYFLQKYIYYIAKTEATENITKIEIMQEIEDEFLIINTLMDNLLDMIEAYTPFKLQNVPEDIRKFIDFRKLNKKEISSDKAFLEHLTEDLIDDDDIIKEKIKKIFEKIDVVKDDITELLATTTKEQRPKFEQEIIKALRSTAPPHLILAFSSNKKDKLAFADELEQELSIKTTTDLHENTSYYLHKKGYYEKLTKPILKKVVKEIYGITLRKTDIECAYDDIMNSYSVKNDYINFKNGVYNFDTNEFVKRDKNIDNEANLENNLIIKNIAVKNDDNTLDLLEFQEDVDVFNKENVSFVEKTLREILIPKGTNDESLFIDFLQRTGACITGKNKQKRATLYYGIGNEGKSILKHLLSLIFNDHHKPITSSTLEDKFKAEGFKNINVITLDEITEDDLNNSGFINEMKKMTSPTGSSSERAIFSKEMINIKYYPPLFIFANNLPSIVDKNDIALLERYDILYLPNRFLNESEINNIDNSYIKNPNLPDLLKKDYQGLNWFITASIKAFEKMGESYMMSQNTNETYRILVKNDIISEFLYIYTYIDETISEIEFTTNNELFRSNKNLCIRGKNQYQSRKNKF